MPPPEWFNHLSTHIIAWTPWAALALTMALAVAMIGRNRLKVQPDLPLRLTAMISQVYAVMMLVMVLCYLLSIPLFISIRMPLRNPQLVFGLAALWILSVGQWFAARRIPSGCVWARNWCIVSWLAYFTAMQWPFDTGYWGVPAGLWVLGVWCRTGMNRWRRTILAVAAFAALLIGFRDYFGDFAITTFPISTRSGSGSGVAARLQKIYVLPGTPEAATHQVAEALVRNLNAAGITAEIADPTAVLEIQPHQEMALWLGRGMLPKLPQHLSLNALFTEKNAPTYVLKTLFDYRYYGWWKGFIFPGLYVSTQMHIAVSRDVGSYSANKVAKEMSEKLLSELKPLTGSDTILIPELPESQEKSEALTIPELQNFRLIARIHESSVNRAVYAFEKTDHDGDLAVITNLLNASGMTTQYGSQDGNYSFYGNGQAELLYWQGKENPESGVYRDCEMKLSTALLEISSSFQPQNETDPEFSKRFLAADPVGFLCANGARQLETTQREEILKQVLPRPNLPCAIRIKILENLTNLSPKLTESEKELLEKFFREVAHEVLQQKSFDVYQRDIYVLLWLGQREGWQHLGSWLKEQMGDRYIRFEVKGTPDANGILEMEKVLKPKSLQDSLCMVEFTFEDFAYQPLTLWLGISPTDDQQWVVREGNFRRTQDSLTFPIAFYITYVPQDTSQVIPLLLHEKRHARFADRVPVVAPETGGMVLTSRMDDKESTFTLHIRFAPLLVEEVAWQKRLNELPSYQDDPEGFEREVLALTDELTSRKHQDGFPQSAMKLLSVCHALTVRQKVAERLGNSYCRIALAAKPDKDGILKGAVTHPVASLTEAQVICEIDGGAAGEPVVFTCFRIGPESVNGRLISENPPTSGKLTFFQTPSANPDDVPASTVKLSPSGQLPDVGQFHLAVDKNPEACELYFQASFRPQKD